MVIVGYAPSRALPPQIPVTVPAKAPFLARLGFLACEAVVPSPAVHSRACSMLHHSDCTVLGPPSDTLSDGHGR